MGIPHLYSFVKQQVPNCLVDVDINKEIDDWFRSNTGNPTIIFDFPSLVHAICNDPLDSFYGCRSMQSYNKTEQFLTYFKDKNVNLVFFEDGPMQVEKREIGMSRHNDRIVDICKILDDLYKSNSANNIIRDHKIRHHGSLKDGIRSIVRKFGKFYKSFHNECDKELVAYATKVNTLAVISNDTDFLIFEGNWNYWSSNDINFMKLTTKGYRKNTLQQYLKLQEREMPLFATLAGNDVMKINLLTNFHNSLRTRNDHFLNKFRNISKYIIQNFRNRTVKPDVIASKICGNRRDLPEFTKLVRESLNSYDVRELAANNTDQNDCLYRFRNLDNKCYEYLIGLVRITSIAYFDIRKPQFENYTRLTLELISRQFGLVLQHKNDKTLSRDIYCCQKRIYECVTIKPIYPKILVPNLDDLYNPVENDNLKMIKLRLLAWILSDRLDVIQIVNIDKKYLTVCLTLFYMVQNEFITVREADIFLHMVETVYENFAILKNLKHLERVDPRAFQIVFLYDKLYQHITDAVSICGLFDMIHHNHMDGLYFHHAYSRIMKSTNNEELNVNLEGLRLYDGLIIE